MSFLPIISKAYLIHMPSVLILEMSKAVTSFTLNMAFQVATNNYCVCCQWAIDSVLVYVCASIVCELVKHSHLLHNKQTLAIIMSATVYY